MKKRYKLGSMLLAAALAAVLLAGAGLAAERLGLFDLFGTEEYPMVPLPGAEEMVETSLGSTENELVECSVQEAVYDGRGMMLQLKITPKDAEQNMLYSLGFYDSVEALYAHRGEQVEAALGGKAPLFYAVTVQSGEQEGGGERWHNELLPDGSLMLWYSRSFAEMQGDAIEVCVEMRTIADGLDAAMEPVRFSLARSKEERSVKLEPVEAAESEAGFAILDAGIVFTKLRGYVGIGYQTSGDPQAALMVQLTDAEGKAFATGSVFNLGRTANTDGSTAYWTECEMQALDVLPEKMWIEAWDIESNRMLHRVECRVVEG